MDIGEWLAKLTGTKRRGVGFLDGLHMHFHIAINLVREEKR